MAGTASGLIGPGYAQGIRFGIEVASQAKISRVLWRNESGEIVVHLRDVAVTVLAELPPGFLEIGEI